MFYNTIKNVINRRSRTYYQHESWGLYYKSFTIVIYDHNDSGQNYKTTILARVSFS